MDFIDFEATVASDNEVGSEDEVSDVDSLKSFIDDKTEIEEDRTCYYKFENAAKSIDETLAEEFDESMHNVESLNEVSNFCESSKEEGEIYEFKDVEKRIEKFEETLHPSAAGDEEGAINSFVYAILFALTFDVSEKLDVCSDKELEEAIGNYLFLKLFVNRDRFRLEFNNHKFNLQCMEINEILVSSSYFLRVYELKKKFRHLSLKNPKKQTIVQQLSICVFEKVNRFNIFSIECGKKLRRKFKPIDMIYKHVKKADAEMKCYFSQDISRAYRNTCNKGEKLSHGFAYQCYYCNEFFVTPDKHKRHMEHCSGVPGIVYNFNNQNLVTFEDNLG